MDFDVISQISPKTLLARRPGRRDTALRSAAWTSGPCFWGLEKILSTVRSRGENHDRTPHSTGLVRDACFWILVKVPPSVRSRG